MHAQRTLWLLLAGVALSVASLATVTVGAQVASSAHPSARDSLAQCRSNSWTEAAYQAASTPASLGAEVLACLKLEYPKSYLSDEIGIVALVHDGRFQNVNEFGLTGTVKQQLSRLGIPPITLEDGPGGILVAASPRPTQLPNELALGATFDASLAAEYGTILGAEAHQMGYDGVQAPALNLVRVPSWGRAMESFGESPVLAGELGGSEAVAIASQNEIPVLKHFGPYSQETDRHALDQLISERAYQEVYLRPFTITLDDLMPLLSVGHHAVAIMCSYGDVNGIRVCRSPELADLLEHLGMNALVRSDLDVQVQPSALLLNNIDLIKPMASRELVRSLDEHAVDRALDRAVAQVFTAEFADGLVKPIVTLPSFRPLPSRTVALDTRASNRIEQRAAVLLKDDGLLPLRRGAGPVVVLGDQGVRGTCGALASVLSSGLASPTSCADPRTPLPSRAVFDRLAYAHELKGATATFTPVASGSYVASVTTYDTATLSMNGTALLSTSGQSGFGVQRTVLLTLRRGVRYRFRMRWLGRGPSMRLIDEQPMIDAAVKSVRGTHVAVVIAYDQAREGMDRSSLALPNAQDALISAVAARVPTVVLLATDGAVTMPWLSQVHGVLEVWSPTGSVYTEHTLSGFVSAYGNLLDGTSDPSGRLPMTFPVTAEQSPMAISRFWPGVDGSVNLGLAPDSGLGIGEDWYRQAGWPVLFPFGFGLSYTTYQLMGGTVTDPPTGLQVSESVRDTGGVAGTEVVQIYADWPNASDEPPSQLVGFAPVTFSARDAARRTVRHVTIPIAPSALSIYVGSGLAVTQGDYCLEAATFDGDPQAWTTGAITLGPGAGGTVTGPRTRLVRGTCPS